MYPSGHLLQCNTLNLDLVNQSCCCCSALKLNLAHAAMEQNLPKVEGQGVPGCTRCYWWGRRSHELRAAKKDFTAVLFLGHHKNKEMDLNKNKNPAQFSAHHVSGGQLHHLHQWDVWADHTQQDPMGQLETGGVKAQHYNPVSNSTQVGCGI